MNHMNNNSNSFSGFPFFKSMLEKEGRYDPSSLKSKPSIVHDGYKITYVGSTDKVFGTQSWGVQEECENIKAFPTHSQTSDCYGNTIYNTDFFEIKAVS